MFRKNVALLSAFIGLCMMVLLTSPAAADPGPASNGPRSPIDEFIAYKGQAFIDRQKQLMDFKSWILTLPALTRSGFVESINDAQNKRTTLLWAGKGSPLQAQIRAEGARRGIAVTFRARKHSLSKIKSAMAAIWARADRGEWPAFEVTEIAGVSADYDGIIVHGRAKLGAAAVPLTAPTSVSGVPVRFVGGSQSGLTVNRGNDTSPYNAGGQMRSASQGDIICTTGFGISINGTYRVTTARHCKASDWKTYSGGRAYGSYVTNSRDGGGRVYSAAGSYLMFDGAWNTENYRKTVIGYGRLSLDDRVCTSGGNSGVHCNIKVTNMRIEMDDGSGTFATIRGQQQTSGKMAVAKGDSGGPVLVPVGDNQVLAAGMMQKGEVPANCYSIRRDTACYQWVLFSSMETIVRSITGASLRTG